MFSEEDMVRVKSIDKKLNDIYKIIDRHGSIVKALADLEGQPAILMLLIAISEQFSKLYKSKSKILDKFNKDDIKGIVDIRNFIAHDYDGVSLSIVEDSLRIDIPRIHKIIKEL